LGPKCWTKPSIASTIPTDNTEAMDDFYLCVEVIVKTVVLIILFFPIFINGCSCFQFYVPPPPQLLTPSQHISNRNHALPSTKTSLCTFFPQIL
jgi:hypothetical protein